MLAAREPSLLLEKQQHTVEDIEPLLKIGELLRGERRELLGELTGQSALRALERTPAARGDSEIDPSPVPRAVDPLNVAASLQAIDQPGDDRRRDHQLPSDVAQRGLLVLDELECGQLAKTEAAEIILTYA